LSRCTLVALSLCLALAAPAAAPADPAAAPEASAAAPEAKASACPSTIRLGNRRYAYFQRRVNCTRARRAVRRLYATYGRQGRPRGFRCRSRNRFRGNAGCRNSTGSRYFGFSR
ncbi:MAG: hypothetical protein M3131_01520, partial [Actinomycetota bacterium]|nr:hypothetical protein [Actinomycetota bacterium]